MKQHIAVGFGEIGMRMNNNITISEFNRISHLIQNAKHTHKHTAVFMQGMLTMTKSQKYSMTPIKSYEYPWSAYASSAIFQVCIPARVPVGIYIVLQIHRIMFIFIQSFELRILTQKIGKLTTLQYRI